MVASGNKVLLETTVGDIEVELWSREAPKACRNFVQLCLENYYNKTKFHRVVREFIVQGGDPTGTGRGGESVYGHPFKDEVHSRLRSGSTYLPSWSTLSLRTVDGCLLVCIYQEASCPIWRA